MSCLPIYRAFDKLAETIRSMVYERSILFQRLWSGLRMLSGWPFAIKAMRLATPTPRPGRAWVPGTVTKAELHGESSPVALGPAGPPGGIPLSVGLLTASRST